MYKSSVYHGTEGHYLKENFSGSGADGMFPAFSALRFSVCRQDGMIVESGNHNTLLDHGGLYAQFYNLQAQNESNEPLARPA